MKFQNATSAQDIKSQTEPLIEDSLGDLNVLIESFSSINSTQPQSFLFIMNDKRLEEALSSQAICILAPLKLKEKILGLKSEKTFLFSNRSKPWAANLYLVVFANHQAWHKVFGPGHLRIFVHPPKV